MTTVDDLFRAYLKGIQPDPKAIERAYTAHSDLREALSKDETFGPLVVGTILSGSYGRDTSILDIKDVDILVKTNLTTEYLRLNKRDSETEQNFLIRLTREAIERTGRTANTKPARRSVNVKLPKEINHITGKTSPELTLDIVPVLIQTDKNSDPMTIADRGKNGEFCNWYNTFPNTQLSDSVDRNDASAKIGDRHSYKPLVKIFRAWKRVHFSSYKAPKGFILECLTASYHNPKAEHWIDALHDLFQNISFRWPNPETINYIPEVHDISNSSPHLIPIAKSTDDVQRTLKKIHLHLSLLEEAREEAKTDLEKAAKKLQRVLGQDTESIYFPLPSDLDESDDKSGSRKSSPFTPKSDVTEAPRFG